MYHKLLRRTKPNLVPRYDMMTAQLSSPCVENVNAIYFTGFEADGQASLM